MSDDLAVSAVGQKIADVMKQVDRIPKRGHNDFHNYDYVLEADLVEHLRPLMLDAGLVMLPSQGERTTRQVPTSSGETTVTEILHTFTILDWETGESVDIRVWGAGADGQDKGPYKAFTGAQKYALMKAFMVATGDDPEHDSGYKPKRTAARGRDQRQSTSGAEELQCPDCGGPVWDNTDDEKSAANGGKRPNFKCKDRDCDWASWDRRIEEFGHPSDAVPDDPGYVGPANEAKRELWHHFKDEFGDEAEQMFSEFIVKCPGIPSHPQKLDAFHVQQALDLIREHGTQAMTDPQKFVQREMV